MKFAQKFITLAVASLMTPVFAVSLVAQINGAPDRGRDEGEGPFDRLIIRGVYVIDGTGAPPFGPADIVIEGTPFRRCRNGVPSWSSCAVGARP